MIKRDSSKLGHKSVRYIDNYCDEDRDESKISNAHLFCGSSQPLGVLPRRSLNFSRHEAKFPSARAPVSFVIETRGQRFNFVRTIGRINVGNKSQLGDSHATTLDIHQKEIFPDFSSSCRLMSDYG